MYPADRKRPLKDAARIGWFAVAVVLIVSGARHVFPQQIYGRPKMAGMPPLMEGRPVVVIGLAELLLGVVLLFRVARRR
jgi:hypothetical protein